MSSPALICMFVLSLLCQHGTHQAWGFYRNHRIREYAEFGGTHKDHWAQFLKSSWSEPAHAADQAWGGTHIVSDKHQCHPENRVGRNICMLLPRNAVPWICSDAEILDPFCRLHRNQSLSWESKKTLSWEYSISALKIVHYTQKNAVS